MNTKCCMPVAWSPSSSTTGMLPMNWPRGAASSNAGKRSRACVLPDEMTVEDGVPVGAHADPEVLREHLGRRQAATDAFVTGALPRVVEAFEHIRHPTGAAFGKRDLAVGVLLERAREDEVAERAH